MHTIQEMAQMCGTTAKTLRFYDKIGLLSPDYTDPANGYRYYTDRQVSKYRLIEEYKRMSFTLSEIRRLMSHSADVDTSEILQLKKVELQEAITACDERLAELERWKQQREQPPQEKTVVERVDGENRIVVRCGDVTRSIYSEPDEMDLCYDAVTAMFVLPGMTTAEDFPMPAYRVAFARTAEMNGGKSASADLSPLYPSEEDCGKAELVLIVIQAGPLVDIAACNGVNSKLCGYFSDVSNILYNMNYYGAEEETMHISVIGLCAV